MFGLHPVCYKAPIPEREIFFKLLLSAKYLSRERKSRPQIKSQPPRAVVCPTLTPVSKTFIFFFFVPQLRSRHSAPHSTSKSSQKNHLRLPEAGTGAVPQSIDLHGHAPPLAFRPSDYNSDFKAFFSSLDFLKYCRRNETKLQKTVSTPYFQLPTFNPQLPPPSGPARP